MGYKRALAIALLVAMLLGCAASAESQYYIDVDIANQIVTVYGYGGDRTQDNIVRQMICSTGYGTSTPTGTFFLPEKKYDSEREEWYWFGKYEIYAKYATRISGPYLFHSILYPSTSSGPTWASEHALGYKASHGCVRLRVADAKWIAENCLAGTCVHIFSDGVVDEDLRQLLMNSSFAADELSYADFLNGMCTLSRGSRFSKVKDLQQALIDGGYLNDSADGVFGPRTEAAVMAWQANSGLEETGVVTPDQLEMILSQPILPAATPTPEATAEPTPVPTEAPAEEVNAEPTEEPSTAPTATPTPIPTATPTPDISEIPGTVALVRVENWLNLREQPDVQSAVLAQLTDGTPVQVLHRGLVWSQVICNGQTGWVGSDYIEIVRN